MNKQYSDYNIIPLGDHCALPIILKELNLRCKSYPFDWITKVDHLHDTNILDNIDIIQSFKTESIDSIVKTYIGDALDNSNKTNSKNNLWFPHDTETKHIVIQKYERRFERLKQDLYKKNVFILLTRHYYIDEISFQKIMDTLLSYNKDSIILFISGSDHKYFNSGKYDHIIFKYINYDISQFYGYDYTCFRPNIKKYLSELFL
jgi:hypothetical protein